MKNSDKNVSGSKGNTYSPDTGSCPKIQDFRDMVLSYYYENGRDLAWRHTSDPYQILVSEIMLQQTQVERVTRKFPEFIEAFPDFEALATASLEDVLSVWQGMGYNRRAISLQKCAVKVITEYNGLLPADCDILATFPGIGSATASSIGAFAFNMPVVFIETNIRRVFIHFFFPHSATVRDAEILPLVKETLYRANPRIWYWALMDLGSALKKTVENPNWRSAHYTKQTPFEGSDRKIRGIILKILLKEHFMEEGELIIRLAQDRYRVTRILRTLESEGFIQRRENGYKLA
jgi:A/G-specific adenine glycosylase